MQKTEIINITMSYVDFQRTLKEAAKEAVEEALTKMADQQKAPPDWEELTLEAAAAELNCCKRTLRARMKQLNIDGLRVGREITLQRRDLKKIRKAQQKHHSTQHP